MSRASFALLLALLAVGCGGPAARSARAAPATAKVTPPDSARAPAYVPKWKDRPEAVAAVAARIAAARTRVGRTVPARGDTAFGDSRTHWQAWFEGREVALIEEAIEPLLGGSATLTYVFERGALVAFRERGDRVGLLPGRPRTFARIAVDATWTSATDTLPRIAYRIEDLPAAPEVELPDLVKARAKRLVALAKRSVRAR